MRERHVIRFENKEKEFINKKLPDNNDACRPYCCILSPHSVH